MPAPPNDLLTSLATPLAQRVKRRIIGEVRAVFNDKARGETPVVRSDQGLFAPLP